MSGPNVQMYVHLVSATRERLPLLTPAVEPRLYHCISTKCQELGCSVVALNGWVDHVHLLVKFPATIRIADLVKEVKGASSHLMTHEIVPDQFFKWQAAYGAFTVQQAGLDRCAAYIRNQKTHHTDQNLITPWETTTVE